MKNITIKSKGSFDIYAKFLIFWLRPYADWATPQGARAKNVKRKSPPTGRNCGNKAISLGILENGKTKTFCF